MFLRRPVPSPIRGERPEGRDRDVGVLGSEVLQRGEVGFGLRPELRVGVEPEDFEADRILVRGQLNGPGILGDGLIHAAQRGEGPAAQNPPAGVIRGRRSLDQPMRLAMEEQKFRPVVPVLPGNEPFLVLRLIVDCLLGVSVELAARMLEFLSGRLGLTGPEQRHGKDGIVQGPGLIPRLGQRLTQIADRLGISTGAVVAYPSNVVSGPEGPTRQAPGLHLADPMIVLGDGVGDQ